MKWILNPALALVAIASATSALGQVTLYEGEGFRGRAFTTDKAVGDFSRLGFNDRASSVVVERGRWEACDDARFAGRCVVLRRGSYSSLANLGLDNKVSSLRPVGPASRNTVDAPEPMANADYAWRRRANERIYEARVTSVREVRGRASERCWVEHSTNDPRGGEANVGGAVIGALIGGVLGHQVGGGRGKDVATAGGAVAGAAIGSNVGRDSSTDYPRDLRKCETMAGGAPTYWDVTYNHRGVEHRVQMSTPPGPSISVNQAGEPRG